MVLAGPENLCLLPSSDSMLALPGSPDRSPSGTEPTYHKALSPDHTPRSSLLSLADDLGRIFSDQEMKSHGTKKITRPGKSSVSFMSISDHKLKVVLFFSFLSI